MFSGIRDRHTGRGLVVLEFDVVEGDPLLPLGLLEV